MKKILFPMIVTCLILVVSANTSFGQQVKNIKKTELTVVKNEQISADVKLVKQREDFQNKNNLKARPVKEKAKIEVQYFRYREEK